MTSHYLLRISYKGVRFSGWQKQVDQHTVQGALEKSLSKISKSEKIFSLASGRTDAGVHALSQYVKVSLPIDLDPLALQRGLNSLIDKDIDILEATRIHENFHPVRDAKSKCYQYVISLNRPQSFERDMVSYFPQGFDKDLFIELAEAFEGEHDFLNYMCQGTPVNTTVRTIFSSSAEISKHDHPFLVSNEYLIYQVTGSGFLKQMVRLIVGTLLKASQSKLSRDEIITSLRQPGPSHLAPVAPASGLYLKSVEYSLD